MFLLRIRSVAMIPMLLSGALLIAGGCASQPATNPAADAGKQEQPAKSGGLLSRVLDKEITVPQGTPIRVTIDQTLTSNGSRPGDSFAASISTPVEVDGRIVIPRGAHVTGRVAGSKESGRLHAPAQLSIRLASVEVAGKSYALETGSIAQSGKGHGKRNAEFIGGGGAAGALIGGLAGGGKGALIGAAAGAGAGTAGAYATGKKEISIPAESRLTFRLTAPVTITVRG